MPPADREGLLARVRDLARSIGRAVRIMEVCGTHTVAIRRSGLRWLLPESVTLVSGPGCPVCVTAPGFIDAAVRLALEHGADLYTFGDLVRVPGTGCSLAAARASGASVTVVSSAADAVSVAAHRGGRSSVFLGVGFETTFPGVAAACMSGAGSVRGRFTVLSGHKTVPAALLALAGDPSCRTDGFLLPGHVSVMTGTDVFGDIPGTAGKACAVAGFEPGEILAGLSMVLEQILEGRPRVGNAYPSVASGRGNRRALEIASRFFEPCDAEWRGLGLIRGSGLAVRPETGMDALSVYGERIDPAPEPEGCICASVITGRSEPSECPLFAGLCTPENPVGPCMVSSEGTCSAWYEYPGGEGR
jgi:hydrogenase expression/formation protein HypD